MRPVKRCWLSILRSISWRRSKNEKSVCSSSASSWAAPMKRPRSFWMFLERPSIATWNSPKPGSTGVFPSRHPQPLIYSGKRGVLLFRAAGRANVFGGERRVELSRPVAHAHGHLHRALDIFRIQGLHADRSGGLSILPVAFDMDLLHGPAGLAQRVSTRLVLVPPG